MKVRIDGTEAMAMYAAAFRRMRALPGFDQKLILRAEAGTILKAWAGRTKIADPKKTVRRAWYRARKRSLGGGGQNQFNIKIGLGGSGGIPGEVWYEDPVTGTRWPAGLIDTDGSFHAEGVPGNNAAWDKIRSGAELFGMQLEEQLAIGRESAGFAQQSVVQCAVALGIDLTTVAGAGISSSGVAKARKAIASNGRTYTNGSGTQGGDDVKSYVECISRLPYGAKIGMDRELASILARRAKFIETSYRKGAFDSVSRAARAFPNVFRVVGSS